MNGLFNRHELKKFDNTNLIVTDKDKLSLYSKITRFSNKKDQMFEIANQGILSVKTHIHNIPVSYFEMID